MNKTALEEARRVSEEKFNKAFYQLPHLLAITTQEEGIFVEVNDAFTEIMGYTREEVIGRKAADFFWVNPEDREKYASELRANGVIRGREFELWHKSGSIVIALISAVKLEFGGSDYYLSTINDVTERKEAELKLIDAQRRMADIINFLPDATFAIDLEGRVISWNKAAEEMTGVSAEEMLGKGDHEYSLPFYGRRRPILIDLVLEPDRILESKYTNIEKRGTVLIGEGYCPALRETGAYLRSTASPLYDSQGKIAGAIESVRDATVQKKAEEQTEFLSFHDTLTGLYNRTFFEQELLRLDSGCYTTTGIMILDLDGLKLVNDTLGHDAGDRLLVAAAGVIRESCQDGEVVSRVGGDEFTVLIQDVTSEGLENIVQRARHCIEEYNDKNPELPLSISIGFAVGADEDTSVYELYRQADNNMYREKLMRKQSTRSSIVHTLMKALETRDFITKGHAERLQVLAVALSQKIGLSENRVNDLILLAQFHDIGKVGVPDSILFKPGPLTPEEKKEMQKHCEKGYNIALAAPDLVPIADWILKHQEWWDGSGYPLGLKGDEIPLECRILAVVDAYDAMTSDRPYRKAMSRGAALEELVRCRGTQFDPRLVDLFIEVNIIDRLSLSAGQ